MTRMKIVSACFQSNEVISIPNAYDDERFTATDKTQDRSAGYRTKQILCVPIRTLGEASLGVLQLVNTVTGVSYYGFLISLVIFHFFCFKSSPKKSFL